MRSPQGGLFGSAGGSRRISAPSLQGTGAGGSGDGSAGEWARGVQGVQRHLSASSALPPPLQGGPAWGQHYQQQHAGAGAGPGGRHGGGVHPHLMSLGRQSFIDPKTYKQLVWADLADDEEEEARLEREIARQLLVGAGRSRAAAAGAAGACSFIRELQGAVGETEQ